MQNSDNKGLYVLVLVVNKNVRCMLLLSELLFFLMTEDDV